MSSKEHFYIGWQEKMPKSTRSFLNKVLLISVVLVSFIISFVVMGQKPFNNHVFEFGTITTVTGVYISDPYPMLQITKNKPAQVAESMLLVGFGKFGAEAIMDEIEEREGTLDLKEITIQGTMIYGDGVTLLELTNKADSFIEATGNFRQPLEIEMPLLNIEVTGEIVDPKCYFGVMKPGEGKIHKSCAIRCISGGMPPVFRVWEEQIEAYRYHLLTGLGGKEINKELLPFIGETITTSGQPYQQLGWNVLEINPDQIQRTLASNE